jgi:Family of unknown function (DUF6221)
MAAFVTARLDEGEAQAAKLLEIAREAVEMLKDPRFLGREVPGWHWWPDVETMSSRALRDVAAKRAILSDYLDCARAHRDGNGYPEVMRAARDAHLRDLMHVAAARSDHPDYRQEWTPR